MVKTLAYPKIISITLLYLLLITFPLGQFATIEIANFRFHFLDLFVGLFVLAWVFLWKINFKNIPFRREIVYFLFFVVFSFFIGLTGHKVDVVRGSLYLLRLITYMMFYLSLYDIVRQTHSKEKLYRSLYILGSLIMILGFVQYLFIPDMRFLALEGWDDHYYRLIGTFFDPGFTGIILVLFTLLLFSRNWGRGDLKLESLLLTLSLFSVSLTYSRASYLALITGITVIYIVRRNFVYYISLVTLFFSMVVLLPRPGGEGVRLERTSTINARFLNYQEGMSLFAQSPLFGLGYNFLSDFREHVSGANHASSGVDSSLLFIAVTTGIAGLISFVNLFSKIWIFFWKRAKTQQGLLVTSSIAALTVHSLFVNSLFYPWVMSWIIVIFVWSLSYLE